MKNINECLEFSIFLLIIKAFYYSPFPLKVKRVIISEWERFFLLFFKFFRACL